MSSLSKLPRARRALTRYRCGSEAACPRAMAGNKRLHPVWDERSGEQDGMSMLDEEVDKGLADFHTGKFLEVIQTPMYEVEELYNRDWKLIIKKFKSDKKTLVFHPER